MRKGHRAFQTTEGVQKADVGSTGNMRKGHRAFQTSGKFINSDVAPLNNSKDMCGGMHIQADVEHKFEDQILQGSKVGLQDLSEELLRKPTSDTDEVEDALKYSQDLSVEILSDGHLPDLEPESDVSESGFDGDISDSADDCHSNQNIGTASEHDDVKTSPAQSLHSQEASEVIFTEISSDESQPDLAPSDSDSSDTHPHQGDPNYTSTPEYVYYNMTNPFVTHSSDSDTFIRFTYR